MPADGDNPSSWTKPLPAAIQRQIREADELARQAGVANMPPRENEGAPGDNPGSPVDNGAEIITEVTSLPAESQPPQTQPEPQPQSQPEPPNWEARFNTLQGKYNSEISSLRGQLSGLQEVLRNFQTQPRAPEPPPYQPVAPTLPTLAPPQTDVENYGQDLINASQRWAELHLTPKFADYERRIRSLETNTQQIAQYSAGSRVEQGLDRVAPGWRDINFSDEFKTWLAQVDPFSGRPRQDLANEAYAAGDVTRTAAFIQAYQREHTAMTPPGGIGTQQSQTGNGLGAPPPREVLPLASQVVPGRGPTATPPAFDAPGKRIWRPADIAAFYDASSRGYFKGREDEYNRLQADFMAAQFENRIRE